MRRAMRYAAIWCGATAVAVSVSWFGVRGVLRNEFVDDVNVEPFLAQTLAADERDSPATPTARRTTKKPAPVKTPATTPAPAPAQTRTPPSDTPSPAKRRTTTQKPASTPTPSPTPTVAKNLEVVKVKGGEVAFTLGPEGCRLVSATPVSGYTAKVSRAEGWIRVDLAKGEHGTGVFCISHEQRTDTWEY
ncbi:hypothetical protein AB0C27_14670 [Nonomuraea sp. NPDC048882]|uniref:hypothetical protein n=1 Tax=Nonomuraea sp. NPDC048882 TaxID=3154347 RepID=UPI0033D59554